MDRKEKIDAILEFLDENNINIIDTTCIGSVTVDAEQSLDKVDDKNDYNELLEKGLSEYEIENFKKFLEKNTLMMIRLDEISGVSFENSDYYIEGLYDTDLWSEESVELTVEEAQLIAFEALRSLVTQNGWEDIKDMVGRQLDVTDEVLDQAVHLLFSDKNKKEIIPDKRKK